MLTGLAAGFGRGLLAVAVGAILLIGTLSGIAKERHQTSELKSHGVAASATVTHVRYSAQRHGPLYISDVVVTFTAAGRPVSGHLGRLGQVPSDTRAGDVLNVVYAAGHPSHVTLANAAHHSHLFAELVFAAMAIGSIAFVLKFRRRHDLS